MGDSYKFRTILMALNLPIQYILSRERNVLSAESVEVGCYSLCLYSVKNYFYALNITDSTNQDYN